MKLDPDRYLAGCVDNSPDHDVDQPEGSPPPVGKLQSRILPVTLSELFAPGRDPAALLSPALTLLQSLVAEESALQKSRASKDRTSSKQLAKLEQDRRTGEQAAPDGVGTADELRASLDTWVRQHGTSRGWKTKAALAFRISEKTITRRMK